MLIFGETHEGNFHRKYFQNMGKFVGILEESWVVNEGIFVEA